MTSLVISLVMAFPVAANASHAGDGGRASIEVSTSGSRPFPPPDTTRTVQIPGSIDSSGATNVRASLTAAIAAAPDRSVISFPAGGVYRIDGGLRIGDRHDLVLDGNGSTFRIGGSGSGASNTLIDIYADSTDIAIRDFKLVGNSPKPGGLIDGQEFAMGVNVTIARRVEISDVTISSVYGDALSVNDWGRAIWFHDSHVISAGKNGVGILAGRFVIVERVTFDRVGLHPFNIEPFQQTGGGMRIRFRDNTVGTYGTSGSDAGQWAVFFTAHGVAGATIDDVTVTGNVVRYRSIQTQVMSTTRRREIAVTNNRSLVEQAPYYNSPAVLWFAHVDGLTVYGNVQPLSDGSLLHITDSTNVDLG